MFLNSLMAFAIHSIEPFAKWLTIAILVGALLVCGYLYLKKREFLPSFLKYATVFFAVYFLLLALVLFVADLSYHYSDEYAEENWLDKRALVRLVLLPLCVLAGSVLLACAVHGYAKSKNNPKLKPLKIALWITVLLVLIVALVSIGAYYAQKIVGDGYFNSDTASVKQFALYAFALLLTAILFLFTKPEKEKLNFDSRSLAYAGVCVSMSFALSYIKLWDMPNGGALTLASLFPLALYSYAFGVKKGLFAGFCYSLLQAIQDPWIIHPAQFLLDYPIAFTSVGLAGIFRQNKLGKNDARLELSLGCASVGLFRYVAHVLSGVFAFEAYAEGQNALLFSLGYNLYVIADIALVIAVATVLLSSKTFAKELVK